MFACPMFAYWVVCHPASALHRPGGEKQPSDLPPGAGVLGGRRRVVEGGE
jgi:hypothetical protein